MSRIRSKHTGPERRLKMAFVRAGIRFKMHAPLPGHPDFVSGNRVIFLHGCFWHGCPDCYRAPKTNKRFWRGKISANKNRHIAAAKKLRWMGYSALIIYECSLRNGGASRAVRFFENPSQR